MIRKPIERFVVKGLVGVSVLVGAFACSTTPNPVVEDVRKAYSQTSQLPDVSAHASLELYEAEKSVDRLEAAWKNGKPQEELEHLAGLAEQKLEIAETRGAAGALEAEVEELGERRDELRLRARTLGREIAEERAEKAELRAELARIEAETASELAEQRAEAIDDLRARAKDLEAQLENVTTREDDRGLVISMDSVLFAFDSHQLMAGSERSLERISDFLSEFPDRRILVEGHTDSVGSETYNARLSAARADSVASALRSAGIDAARIRTSGVGEAAPIASNETAAGRQQNRRVEIVLEKE